MQPTDPRAVQHAKLHAAVQFIRLAIGLLPGVHIDPAALDVIDLVIEGNIPKDRLKGAFLVLTGRATAVEAS